MATSDRQDGERRTGDELDRVIDEAVETALRAGVVDLRAQVLEGLDRGPAWQGRRYTWPAFLPVAGALLMMAGVGLLWQHALQQLDRNGARVAATHTAASRSPGHPAEHVAQMPAAEPAAAGRPAAAEPSARPLGRAGAPEGARSPKAPAWLESDSDQKIVGVPVLVADADGVEALSLPGAPAGDLGDPIAPMPKPRPIAIEPLATPPILVAPPISTLAKPVSTLSDDVSRDRQDPGKPGGM